MIVHRPRAGVLGMSHAATAQPSSLSVPLFLTDPSFRRWTLGPDEWLAI
ncbi:MAG TPA: hypothetical protein VK272_04885 [Solirubrobacteraceae bacterium]|nr:hypothetical protein [Solirubrobacteraceae bacterium]